ncbi:MAG: hypothetical protein KDD37_10235 [Bdellovibrionales bacterium]|nr:hypothetical protein [Bdellovibrionales bacterium]
MILFAFLFSIFAVANERPAKEVSVSPQLISTTDINDTPTYFFKPSPDGRYYTYTTWKPSDGHYADKNILLDSQSGVSMPIPGAYDPMFTLNMRNVIVPGQVASYGLRFYHLEDLINQGVAAQPFFNDTEFKGVYESIAVLRKTATEVIYRVIIEFNSRYFRDYKETLDASGKTIKMEIISPVTQVCSNYKFALPMISKTGTEFSGLDYSVGKSRVYKLNNDGTCEVSEELGYLAGKIAFGYNSRYIAFHVFEKADKLGNYAFSHISAPDSKTVANIYLKDRLTNTTYKLSNYVDGNAMYPEFLANGDIVYILHPHDTSSFKVRFVRIRPTIY